MHGRNAGNDAIAYTFGDGTDTIDGGADTDTLTITATTGNDVLDVIYNGTRLTNFEGSTVANVESVIADLLGGTDTLNFNGTTSAVITLTPGKTASASATDSSRSATVSAAPSATLAVTAAKGAGVSIAPTTEGDAA